MLVSLVGSSSRIDSLSPDMLQCLQSHSVDLCRENAQCRLDELKAVQKPPGDTQYAARKEHFLKLIQKLVPGNTSANVDAIVEQPGGSVLTEPDAIAQALTTHWQEVFSAKPADQDKMDAWLRECDAKLPFNGEPIQYMPTEEDFVKIIREANSSSPGPDGIPFSAAKTIAQLAAPIFHSAALFLYPGSPDDLVAANPFFNEAFLTCLGKNGALHGRNHWCSLPSKCYPPPFSSELR